MLFFYMQKRENKEEVFCSGSRGLVSGNDIKMEESLYPFFILRYMINENMK